MLRRLEENQFDQVYQIMRESFPLNEFRPYAEQKALLRKPVYQIYVCAEGERVRGFLAVYEWEDLLFIEHFAVANAYRNLGLGGKMLNALLAKVKKQVCLEVELPETELSRRRIAFYERQGFVWTEYPYVQPAISQGRAPVPLRLMTAQKITEGEFLTIKTRLYQEVYGIEE